MQTSMITLVVAAAAMGQVTSQSPIPKKELEYQQQTFEQWWGQPLAQTLEVLPSDGGVPEYRVPYSGFDYPDRAGGTVAALSKYDRAFNRGRPLATEFERRDVGDHRRPEPLFTGRPLLGGLFARIRESRGPRTPSWYGHCNGWTAASIRHAEPQYNVTRNGVVFTPADIKGMLAEIYMYTDTEFLGGESSVIHPALFHLTLTNWVGRGDHPIGMETALGEVVVNYPIYNYKSKVSKYSEHQREVATTITYAMNTNFEANKSQHYHRQMFFHYLLDLNENDEVIGGVYYTDSAKIDMLWTPLQPIQGGKKGNERGNPHVDIKQVLSIWRDSVPEDLRKKWLNIDPTDEDRVVVAEEQAAAPTLPEPKPAESPPADGTTPSTGT